MKPEQLVPTLETCRALKEAGYKQGTYFVFDKLITGRIMARDSTSAMSIVCAAPTLQELLDRLPKYTYVSRDGAAYIVTAPPDKPDCDGYSEMDDNFNAAEAAALLWLELRKEGNHD